MSIVPAQRASQSGILGQTATPAAQKSRLCFLDKQETSRTEEQFAMQFLDEAEIERGSQSVVQASQIMVMDLIASEAEIATEADKTAGCYRRMMEDVRAQFAEADETNQNLRKQLVALEQRRVESESQQKKQEEELQRAADLAMREVIAKRQEVGQFERIMNEDIAAQVSADTLAVQAAAHEEDPKIAAAQKYLEDLLLQSAALAERIRSLQS